MHEQHSQVRIRESIDRDSAAMLAVHRAAFQTGAEASLVQRLLADGNVVVSLVAVESDAVVGHVLLSRIVIAGENMDRPALALAPVAVLPDRQNRGIGSVLIVESLKAARSAGWGSVIVLGHPWFYPRFGFVPATPLGILPPWPDVPDEAWMVAELVPDALDGVTGVVHYAPAFDELV